VDFDNLVFGRVFSDHMFECNHSNGSWQHPTIKPHGNISLSPGAKVFHYGQAVFEGMKAYKADDGGVFLFRPQENFRRLNLSAKRMAIPEIPETLFFEALETLLKLDSDWAKPGLGNSLYIRPFVFATQTGVAALPSSQYKFMVLLSPVQAYYTGEVKVVIAEKYSRAADGGVGYAKAAGNYGAQFYPTNMAREQGFKQVIWTDAKTHQYVEEAGTMNMFFRLGDTLLTAPTSDRILDGVTRKSVLALAQRNGIPHEVRPITVAELVEGAKSGALKEVFGTGTASVVNPVSAFSHGGHVHKLPAIENSYASKLKTELMNIQYNRSEDPFGWRYQVI
ncbi:MAG: branched-chain amino acid aminotransferase, partial [Marinirhabdus sp.]